MEISISYFPNLPWTTEFLLLEANGLPTDLIGTSFRMHVRASIEKNEILAIASSENNKIEIVSITSTYNNQEITGDGIKLTLTAEDTLAIYQASRTAVADVEMTFPDGTVLPEILEFLFKPNITVTRDY